jgi:hypothetical protein
MLRKVVSRIQHGIQAARTRPDCSVVVIAVTASSTASIAISSHVKWNLTGFSFLGITLDTSSHLPYIW